MGIEFRVSPFLPGLKIGHVWSDIGKGGVPKWAISTPRARSARNCHTKMGYLKTHASDWSKHAISKWAISKNELSHQNGLSQQEIATFAIAGFSKL